LRPSGILIIPVEEGAFAQKLSTYEFDEGGKVEQRFVCGVRFVPLKDAPTFLEE
jgi:protein-L-isoaspartate O-methyltransferase